jgi:predicted enzyme related to lactoylglutathione lyase
MTVRVAQWTIDVNDTERMAEFWSAALDYRTERGEDGSAKLYPPDDASPGTGTVWLQQVATAKPAKNRVHPDLRPSDGDVEREVGRLLALGARRIDIGQSDDDPFVVLADPEGNEFCVLRREPREV